MKKLLSVLLVGLFTVVWSFASADTVDWFTSDNNICSWSISDLDNISDSDLFPNEEVNYSSYDYVFKEGNCYDNENDLVYFCVSSSDVPFVAAYYWLDWVVNSVSVSSSNTCFSSPLYLWDSSFWFTKNISWKLYFSKTPITYSSSAWWSDSSDSLLNPWVISSWVQSWVNAFTSWLWNLIPTLLLFGLPILVIVLFWNKVRSYLKRIFTRR